MKNYTVKYYHGHFIDLATNKRIIPLQGAEFAIVADNQAFQEADEKLILNPPLSSDEKHESISRQFGEKNIHLFLPSGTHLYFRVGNSKKVKGDESNQYIFMAQLLEDQYLHKIGKRNGENDDDWRLAPCQCELVCCLRGGLTLTEPIPTTSLNSLFSFTVMFYFSLQRSAACNVFDTFFIFKDNEIPTFQEATWGQYKSNNLGGMRKAFFLNLKAQNKLKNS